jgi:hypothetical protein
MRRAEADMGESINNVAIYRVEGAGEKLGSGPSAIDLIGATYGQAIDLIVVPVTRFDPEFFRLGSGLAGEFIQKLQQYGLRLAIVGDIEEALARSKPLQDFVRETNRHGQHLFVRDEAELEQRLHPQ